MIRTVQSPSRLPRIHRPSARMLVGVTALVGSGLVAIGVALPWLTFFAGLQQLSALGTTNGYVLLAAATITALLGLAVLVRGVKLARHLLAAIGIALTAFSAYLVVQFVATYREASADPFVVAAPGPGLVIVTLGAVAVLATALVRD